MREGTTNTTFNRILILALIFLSLGLLYLLQPILMPFVAGALLAYLTDPLVNKLMAFNLSRFISVLIVFLLLFVSILLLVLLFIPLIQQQIAMLVVLLPNSVLWLQAKVLPWLIGHFQIQENIDGNIVKNLLTENLSKAGSIINWILKTVFASGKVLFETILNIILIPVVTFYLLRDWNLIIDKIREIIPKKIKPKVIAFVQECDVVLSAFFRGQLFVMLLLGVYYAVALTVVGLQVGIIIGIIIGLLSIVPYLGLIIGIIIASIAALVQFGTFVVLLWVLSVFAIGSLLENFVLVPKLIGDRIGLHPVTVIFAVLAGGTLFGFFGILLALPAAAVLMVLLRHVCQHYRTRSFSKAM